MAATVGKLEEISSPFMSAPRLVKLFNALQSVKDKQVMGL
jgi:hypothetical protein